MQPSEACSAVQCNWGGLWWAGLLPWTGLGAAVIDSIAAVLWAHNPLALTAEAEGRRRAGPTQGGFPHTVSASFLHT